MMLIYFTLSDSYKIHHTVIYSEWDLVYGFDLEGIAFIVDELCMTLTYEDKHYYILECAVRHRYYDESRVLIGWSISDSLGSIIRDWIVYDSSLLI